jgi:hypothetical protein
MKISEKMKKDISDCYKPENNNNYNLARANELLKYLPKVEQLEKQNKELLDALVEFKIEDCFCQVGIHHPMLNGIHSDRCTKSRKLIEKATGKKWSEIIKDGK